MTDIENLKIEELAKVGAGYGYLKQEDIHQQRLNLYYSKWSRYY